MLSHISQDHSRYRDIVSGKVRGNLANAIRDGGFSIDQGTGTLRVPVKIIDLPSFRFSERAAGGVGFGEGGKGDPTPTSSGSKGKGHSDSDAAHDEAEFDREQFARFLLDTFELPNMRNVEGAASILSQGLRYDSTAPVGVIRDPRRTIKKALRRTLSSGTYTPGDALEIQKGDFVFRHPRPTPDPTQNAVIGYMLDVSASTADVINYLKMVAYATDCLVSLYHPKVDRFYVQYDSRGREVTSDRFYKVGSGGSTDVNAGYKKVMEIVGERYSPSDHNLYLIHLTDGDTWGLDTSTTGVKRAGAGYRGSVQVGNLLIDSIIRTFNCVYVAEAGNDTSANFSEYFRRLIKVAPELAARLRFSSYNDLQVSSDPVSCLSATLRSFFT